MVVLPVRRVVLWTSLSALQACVGFSPLPIAQRKQQYSFFQTSRGNFPNSSSLTKLHGISAARKHQHSRDPRLVTSSAEIDSSASTCHKCSPQAPHQPLSLRYLLHAFRNTAITAALLSPTGASDSHVLTGWCSFHGHWFSTRQLRRQRQQAAGALLDYARSGKGCLFTASRLVNREPHTLVALERMRTTLINAFAREPKHVHTPAETRASFFRSNSRGSQTCSK